MRNGAEWAPFFFANYRVDPEETFDEETVDFRCWVRMQAHLEVNRPIELTLCLNLPVQRA